MIFKDDMINYSIGTQDHRADNHDICPQLWACLVNWIRYEIQNM